jgi:hypothetical protein
MNSINSLLSPEGYHWGVPSISDGVSQDHADPSHTSAQSHADRFDPYESFNAATTNTSQALSAFPEVQPRFPSPEDVTMEEQAGTQQENLPGPSNSPQLRAPRRTRHGNLDLEDHKEELKRLYLIEDKSLKDVMGIMKENHSLPES